MPITRLLFPDYGGDSLDSHKAFTVHYKIGQDLDLSYHYDNAEVTLNVSLGKEFTGGELFFGDMKEVLVLSNREYKQGRRGEGALALTETVSILKYFHYSQVSFPCYSCLFTPLHHLDT